MRRVYEIFKIRPGEERKSALLVGLMLFTAAGGALGGDATEALFFARFGVALLPVMYIILGVFTFVTSMAVTALMGRVAKQRLYVALPVVLAFFLLAERLVILLNLKWFYAFMWLAMNVIGLLQGLVTWGLASAACDTRQAKRLFPLFSAGLILGTVLGGLVTPPLANWLHSENLLLVWAGALLVTYALGRALTGQAAARQAVSHAAPPGVVEEMQRGYQFVRRSPMMQWISYSALLFSICFFSLALPYSRAVTAQFPDADRLAGFLGLFQGVYTGAALLASLFLTNRLFARFGIMLSLLFYPFIYAAGFGILAVAAPFALLVVVRFAQMAYTSSVAETAWQASFNVVPPEQRDQVRAFMGGAPTQAGTVIAGLILLAGQQALQPQQLYLVGFAAAALLAFVTWRASGAYAQALVKALRDGQPQVFFDEEAPFGSFHTDAAAVAVALRGLGNADAGIRRVAAEIAGHLKAAEAAPALAQALGDGEAAVRAAALMGLASLRASVSRPEISACLSDPDPEVRAAAVDALRTLAAPGDGIVAQVEPLLADADPLVRARAAQALLCTAMHDRSRDVLYAMASGTDPQLRARAVAALGESGDEAALNIISNALDDAQPSVRRAAYAALVEIDPTAALPQLIAHLHDEDPSARAALAEALGKIGEPALEPLVEALGDPDKTDGALLALAHLPARKAEAKIRDYARAVAQAALHYHTLAMGIARQSAGAPDRDGLTGLLVESLRDRARRSGLNALRALGLAADGEPVMAAVEHLDSRQASQRANALEMLESVGEREIVRPLLALWETAEAPPVPLPPGWLGDLLDDPHPWLRACAVAVAGKTGADGLHEKLKTMSRSDSDEFVCSLAENVLVGEPGMDTLATLTLMDRILFLRRVPLFDGLSPADLKQVAAIAREVLFSDGQVMARQDELGTEMFILVSGDVRVLVAAGGQKEPRQVARRHAGDCVGEMSIITEEPRIATLITEGEVRALCIGQKEFEGILRERPETSLALIRTLCQRLKESGERAAI